jgi:hypothetical protein
LFRHAWHCFQINDLLIFQFLLVFGWKPINHSAKYNFHARRKSLQRIILKVKVGSEKSHLETYWVLVVAWEMLVLLLPVNCSCSDA